MTRIRTLLIPHVSNSPFVTYRVVVELKHPVYWMILDKYRKMMQQKKPEDQVTWDQSPGHRFEAQVTWDQSPCHIGSKPRSHGIKAQVTGSKTRSHGIKDQVIGLKNRSHGIKVNKVFPIGGNFHESVPVSLVDC